MVAFRLPPLSALRAFEAAGRHLSFKKAAEELYLTPSAISRAVKSLEDHLGLALFKRYNRALRLTDDGQSYLLIVRDSFERLARGTEQVRQRGRRRLTLSLPFSLASYFLLPRLSDFERHYPTIDLRLETSNALADLDHGQADLAIRMSDKPWPGLASHKLLDLELFPICSPTLAGPLTPLRDPADLVHHTIVNVPISIDGWRLWLEAVGLPDLQPLREIRLDNQQVAIDAAVQGLGLALGATPLVAGLIAKGHLIRPFPQVLKSPKTFWLVHRPGDGADPAIIALRDWLLDQMSSAQASPA